MKVGEIWEYVGGMEFSELFLEDTFSGENKRVRITNIFKEEDMETIYDGEEELDVCDMEDFVEFEHLGNGTMGILDRPDFIELYRKVYE